MLLAVCFIRKVKLVYFLLNNTESLGVVIGLYYFLPHFFFLTFSFVVFSRLANIPNMTREEVELFGFIQ